MESNPPDDSEVVLPGTSDALLLDPPSILSAVKAARQSGKPQLRKQLLELREDIEQNRQSTRHPLQLFPLEVWLMILRNLEDIKDFTNCAQSNNVLLSILSSPQELFFCKVLPHLVPYFGKPPASTIVVCGKVCQKWRRSVDRFADHYYRVKSSPCDRIKLLTQQPMPQFPNKQTLNDDNHEISKRPFLSEIHLPLFRLYNERLSILNIVGHCLWKLSLEFGTFQTYWSPEVYAECAKAIEKCRHLKSFRLLDSSNCKLRTDVQNNEENDQFEFIPPSTLESLEVLVKTPGILTVQDALLQKLSEQLKRVEVYHWNHNAYHALAWTDLTELEIRNQVSLEVISSLQQIRAPKLYKLYIHWDINLSFEKLLNIVNHVGSLRHLSILLTTAVSDKNLTSKWKLLTTNQLSTLEIYSQELSDGLNIPVIFPLLHHLVFHYDPSAAKNNEIDFKENTIRKANSYIQFYNNMYCSNVWTMLPRLETLALVHRQTTRESKKRRFTRLGYIWSTEKHELGVQLHMFHIREKQKEEQKMKLIREQEDLMENVQRELRWMRWMESNVMKNHAPIKVDQFFSFIIPYLAHADILSCRLACKHWRTTISDSILDISTKSIPITIQVPLSQMQLQTCLSFIEEHTSKPLFARNVEIQITEDVDCANDVKIVLMNLGKYIRHLTIKAEIPLVLINVYQICVVCMNQCSNLHSLSLHMHFVECIVFRPNQETAKPANLESISFYGRGFGDKNRGLYALRRHLQQTFTNQLKTLVLPKLTGESNVRIRELTVTNFETVSTLQSAVCWYGWEGWPELRKLRLCLTQHELCCRDLCDIIIHCTRLEFLELQFSSACFCYDKIFVHWDLCFAKTVTEFQIVLKNKYQIGLNFLVLFPCVQTLRIIYGKSVVLLNEQIGEYEEDEKCTSLILPKRSPDNDFILLARYLMDEIAGEHDAMGIYASNIWSVLPRLKTLEIVHCAKEQGWEKKVFYRRI